MSLEIDRIKMKFKRVFILGAGSNARYGFPTGGELRDLIILEPVQTLPSSECDCFELFKTCFLKSGMKSVDRFLEKNSDLVDIGKKVVAWHVSKKEARDGLHSSKDNWYFYLFNRILPEMKDLGADEISFITFNYDRSLEFFLSRALEHTFRKEADQLKKYRDLLKVDHVYGQIGTLEQRPYIPPDKFTEVDRFYDGIHLLDERDKNVDRFDLFKNIIKEADVIYCIGFGFDPINMERIGLDQSDLKCKAIFATFFDLGFAERIFIRNRFHQDHRKKLQWYSLKNKSIVEFLRDLYLQDSGIVEWLSDFNFYPDDFLPKNKK